MIKQFIKQADGGMWYVKDNDERVDVKGLASFDVTQEVDCTTITATARPGQEVIAAASMIRFREDMGVELMDMTVTFEIGKAHSE